MAITMALTNVVLIMANGNPISTYVTRPTRLLTIIPINIAKTSPVDAPDSSGAGVLLAGASFPSSFLGTSIVAGGNGISDVSTATDDVVGF